MNTEGLCGFSDWRVPTIHELLSIIDFSASSPSIDINYFPNNSSNGQYWSADSGIKAGAIGINLYAHGVLFSSGYLYLDSGQLDKLTPNYVRLVR